MTNNITVRPNWAINTYTVTYNLNGGTCNNSSVTVNYNSTASAPNCSRSGYTRTGYVRTSGSGGNLNTTTGEITNVSGNQTIQPQYNILPSPPSSLLTEGATNPVGVTDTTPEFSAIYNDGAGDTASSYQIQVNTNSTFTGTTMWDSGRTTISPQLAVGVKIPDVSYAGTALSLNGATYYWRIRFWDSVGGVGAWSYPTTNASFTMNTPPTSPTDIRVDNFPNPTQLTNLTPKFTAIFNDPNTGDTGNYYEIQVNTNNTFTGTMMWNPGITPISPIAIGATSSQITYAGTTLSTNGATYYWRIRFSDNHGTVGDWSNTHSFRMLDVPSPATNLTGTALTTGSIRWSFTDNANSETGVYLYDGSNNLIKTCGGSNITYCDETGLQENTQYTRYIVVYNTEANSPASNTASAYTLLSPPTLQFSGIKTDTTVTLTSSQPVNSGQLYFDCDGTCDQGINVWTTNSTAVVTGLQNNTSYSFVVKARNGDNVETVNSSPVSVYTYASIPTLTSSAISTTSMTLSATGINNLLAGQSGLYFECTSSNCNNGISEWIKTNSDTVLGLSTNTQYSFRVRARNFESDLTDWSDSSLRYTLSSVPSMASATVTSSSTINLTFGNADNPTTTELLFLETSTGQYVNPSTGFLVSTPVWTQNSSITQPLTVRELNSGVTYSFVLKARNGDNVETAYSSPISATTLLGDIQALTPTVESSTSIIWNIGSYTDPITGISLYDEDGTLLKICPGVDITSCTETDLLPSVTYRRKLKTHNSTSESSFSNIVTATTFANTPSLKDVVSTDYTKNTISLLIKEQGNSSNTKYAIIEYNSGKYVNPEVGQLQDDIYWGTYTKFGGDDGTTVKGLSSNLTYSFAVKAKNIDDIETTYSLPESVITLADLPSVSNAQPVDTTSVKVVINPATNPESTEFVLYDSKTQKYIDPNTGLLVTDPVWADISAWGGNGGIIVKDLLANTEHNFCIKARNSENIQTDCTGAASVFTNSVTPSISGKTLSPTSVELAVNIGNNPIDTQYQIQDLKTGYYLNREGILSSTPVFLTASQISNVSKVVGLSPNTNYSFVARTQSGAEILSDWTAAYNLTTYANTPDNTSSKVIDGTSVLISFSSNGNPSTTEYAIIDVISKKYVDYITGTLSDSPVWGTYEQWGGTKGMLVKNLENGVEYTFAVKARNTVKKETSYDTGDSILTAFWILIGVRDGIDVTLVNNPAVDVTDINHSQNGNQEVRIEEDGYLIADIPILFDQNLNWSGEIIAADPENNKAVVNLDNLSGKNGSFTLYVLVGDTNRFRICPYAKSLSDVTSSCPGGVLFEGPYPQTQVVGTSSVTVSIKEVKGKLYWVASGMNNGGGIGEKATGLERFWEVISEGVLSAITWAFKVPESQGGIFANLDVGELTLASSVMAGLAQATSIATIAPVLGGFSQLGYVLVQFFSNILAAIGLIKKKYPSGYVYNSVTKDPLGQAIVRIYDKNGSLVATEVTDRDGIFWCKLEDGYYTLDIRKSDFIFPTQIVLGKDDYPMTNVYRGESVRLGSDQLKVVIPLDSSVLSTKEKRVTILRSIFKSILNVISILFFIVGITMSIFAFIKAPTLLNAILQLLYFFIIIMVWIVFSAKYRRYGKVVDDMGKVAKGVEVILKNKEYEDIIGKRITDDEGKYSFYVNDNGTYVLEIPDKRKAMISGNEDIIIKKKSTIAKKIVLKNL